MKNLIFIIIILLFAVPLSARTPLLSQEEVLVGTRPLSMGGAFIATADDVNSIGWNPAGLAFLKNNEITFSIPLNPTWSRDLEIGFNDFYGAAAFPFKRNYVLAMDWFHIGYSDDPSQNWNNKPELEYAENRVTLALARKFGEDLKIGTSLKYYNMGVDYDGASEGGGNGLGMDIGINYRFLNGFRAGLLFNNFFSAIMFYDSGESGSFMLPAIRLGVACTLLEDTIIEFAFDDMIHLGAEYSFLNLFSIRGGFQKEILHSGEPIYVSGGTGIRYDRLQIDYGINYTTHLKFQHNVSLTYRFGYKVSLVDVSEIEVEDIFASMNKSYAKKNIVSFNVKNKHKDPLRTKVGFFIEKYMDSPTEKVMTLKPGQPTKVSLPIVFNREIMERTDDGPVSSRVIITYEHEKQKNEDESTKQIMLYSRNAFTWNELEKLAVFVTPNDEDVKKFTRGVIQMKAQQELEDEFISTHFYHAMLLFIALGEYGMTYVVDPNTPFAEVSQNKNAIDYVQAIQGNE